MHLTWCGETATADMDVVARRILAARVHLMRRVKWLMVALELGHQCSKLAWESHSSVPFRLWGI